MKHGCFRLSAISLRALYFGLFLLYASPVNADSINFSSEFLNTELSGTIRGLFNVVDGNVDHPIDEVELNSLAGTGSVPDKSVSFYWENPRYVRDAFSLDQPSNVTELGLDAGAPEALINFIGASAF